MNVATIMAGKDNELITASTSATLLEIAKTLREHRIGCIVLNDATCGL